MSDVMPLYATVGCNRPAEATAFYGELLGTLGWKKIFDNPAGGAFFGHPNKGMLGVVAPYDGKPGSVGNGMMVAFAQPSNDAVDAFHAKALALGGTDEGPPGYRGPESMGAYFAYFRDPEGNKLCAYHWVMPG